MSETSFRFLMWFLALAGSMGVFTFIYRLFLAGSAEAPGALGTIARQGAGEASALERLNPSGGLVEKLDFFFIHTVGLGRRLDDMHMLMGRPQKPTPLQVLHYKELSAVVIPAVLYFLLKGPGVLVPLSTAFLIALSMPLAFFAPDALIRARIQDRQRQILRGFPAFVDLAALTIESGLDYMSAFDRIVKAAVQRSALEAEAEKMLGEMQLGYSRRDALRRMATRTGLQDVRSFVGLVIQSDELGTSLVDLLRNFASDLRFRRLNKAEKAAAQASTKMLIPIIFFIFPTVFILMLAPMLVSLFRGGLGF